MGPAGIVDHEFVDPDRLVGVPPADGKALLDNGLQAHVLEDGQDLRKGHGLTGVIDLEAEGRGRIIVEPVAADPQGCLGRVQRIHLGGIAQGFGGVVLGLVAGREGAGIAGQQLCHPAGFHPAAAGGLGEAVGPGAGDLVDRLLQGPQVRLRMATGGDAEHIVDPGKRLGPEIGVIGRDPSAPGLGQQLADLLAHLGIVPVPGDEDDGGDEPVEGIPADEDPRAGPVEQVQDAHGGVVEIVLLRLEEFVPGIALDDVAQSLLVVGAGVLPGAGEHMADLAADQGDVPGGLVIGLGGEQADEAHLADGGPVRGVALHAHIIHVGPPVDAGAQVGLGHDQGGRSLQIALQLRGQQRRLAGPAQHRQFVVPQHAQAGVIPVARLLRRIVAIGEAGIFIDPGTEEDEMILPQPAQEVEILLHRLRRSPRGPGPAGLQPAGKRRAVGREGLLQLRRRLTQEVAHGFEIGHGLADIGERRRDTGHHAVPAVLAHGDHGDDDDGFPATVALRRPLPGRVPPRGDHRVEHGADIEAAVRQLAHHAVHEEGGIGLGHHQQVQTQGLPGRSDRRREADHGFAVQMVRSRPGLDQPGRQVPDGDPRKLIGPGIVEGLIDKVLLRGRKRPETSLFAEGFQEVFPGKGDLLVGSHGIPAIIDPLNGIGSREFTLNLLSEASTRGRGKKIRRVGPRRKRRRTGGRPAARVPWRGTTEHLRRHATPGGGRAVRWVRRGGMRPTPNR